MAWTYTRIHIGAQRWSVLDTAWIGAAAVLLAVNPETYQNHPVWLLPPMALLGAAQLDGLRRGATAFINWFGIMIFGFLVVFLWIGFFAMNYGQPAKLAERAAYLSPYYIPGIDPVSMAVTLSFAPLWLWTITRKNIRGRQTVTNWAVGVTLVQASLMTLFPPRLDVARSHTPVVRRMETTPIPELKQRFLDGPECISVAAADRHARITWTQYGSLKLNVDNPACHYCLVQQLKNTIPPRDWM